MQTEIARPRVSRETRRLLAAAGLALLTLWILARLRFPERPPSPNPVAPVLTQISPPTSFAGLAQETARVEQRIAPLLSVVTWQAPGDDHARAYPAWPWRSDLAIAMVPSASALKVREPIKAIDPPTGLALVTVAHSQEPTAALWTPDRLDVPRYFFAATAAASRPAVAPVYVSSLEPRRSPAWSMDIWRVPAATGLAPGALVFTAAGEWLGMVAEENGDTLIVPAMALFDLATRLSQPRTPPGSLGFQIQQMDAKLAAEIGVARGSGVIVAWIDPHGAAANVLASGDVIEALNGAGTPTAFAWHVHSSRLGAGQNATLKVRRAGELQDVTLVVPPASAVPSSTELGLTLVRAPGVGSRITRVAPRTAGDRAGLKAGDIVTNAGDDAEPPPDLVRRIFERTADGGAVVLGIRRGDTHRLVVLTR